MCTVRLNVHGYAVLVTLALSACRIEDPTVSSETLYERNAATCNKVALEINNLTRVGSGGVESTVNAAYMQRVAQAGPRLLRIDVDANMRIGSVLDQMADPEFGFGKSKRARFTLAVDDKANPTIDGISIEGAELDKANGSCGACPQQREWIGRYVAELTKVTSEFICQGLRVENVEIFPHPNKPRGTIPVPVHATWFVEILREVRTLPKPPLPPEDVCDLSNFIDPSSSDCDRQCIWDSQWTQIHFVSGVLDGSDLPKLATYINNISQALGTPSATNLFPVEKFGLDVRNLEQSDIDTALTSVIGFLANRGQRQIDVLFGWDTSTEANLRDRIERALNGPPAAAGFEGNIHVSRAYFSALHSNDATDGIFANPDSGPPVPIGTVGDKLQERACLNYFDYIFVFDMTGSMHDDIAEARTHAIDIIDRTIFGDPLSDPRVALVQYRDFAVPPFGGSTDYLCRVEMDFTYDKVEARTTIARDAGVQGGGDDPEAVYSGLMTAINHRDHIDVLADAGPPPGSGPCLTPVLSLFRAHSERVVILLGDFPPRADGCEPPLACEPFTLYTNDDVVNKARCPADELNPFPTPEDCPAEVPVPAGLQRASTSTSANPTVRIFPIYIDACSLDGECPVMLPEFQRLADETGGRAIFGGHGFNLVDLIGEVVDEVLADPPNAPPITDGAYPSEEMLWSPNHELVEVAIEGIVDPDGDSLTIMITGITQDEPVDGPGVEKSPDAFGLAGSQAQLRAERLGGGNGRVYRIEFIARDDRGAAAPGSVEVCVPHDQNRPSCVDDGQDYDSMVP